MDKLLMAELEKCIANMERDINECDKIYIHISNAKALVNQLNRTQPNEPVKHGKWIAGGIFDEHDIKYGRHNYVCNRCKQYALYFVGGSENWWCSSKPSYCPNCGAKMDKESDNNA